MNSSAIGGVLRQIGLLLDCQDCRDVSDAQLLERFLATREESAFAALLYRYGPLVLHVCRRVLPEPHDAEDAFQATFLLLVRKAGTIRKHSSIASWLHGTAYRLAVHLRRQTTKRAERERKVQPGEAPEPGREAAWRELQDVLDAELAALPDKYRSPLVLCYLEGKTQEEASRQLGWPIGTTRGRLARARELLRRRLSRRGLDLSAAALGTALAAQTVDACVSPMLTANALQSSLKLAAGQPPAAAASARVAALVEGALETMTALPLKLGLALVLTAGLALGASALFSDAKTKPDAPEGKVAPAAPAAENEPRDALGDSLPPGARVRLGSNRFFPPPQASLRPVFSADSKVVAVAGPWGDLFAWEVATGKVISRIEPSERGLTNRAQAPKQLVLLPDGKHAVTIQDPGVAILRELASGKEVRRFTADQVQRRAGCAVSPDGKLIAMIGRDGKVLVWEVVTGKDLPAFEGGREAVKLTDDALAFSADGKHAVVGASDSELRMWEVATGKEVRTFRGHRSVVQAAAFSHDGKRLASVGTDCAIRLWDAADGKAVRAIDIRDFPTSSRPDLAFDTTDRRVLLSGSGIAVRAWDLASGREVGIGGPRGDNKVVAQPAFDPTEAIDSRTVDRFMPPTPGRRKGEMTAQELSPDGKVLAIVGGGGRLKLWDVEKDREMHSFDGHDGAVSVVAVSAAGVIATGGSDHSIHLWDPSGKPLRVLRSHTAAITHLCFSPDGKKLASACGDLSDRVISLWDVASGEESLQVRDTEKSLRAALSMSISALFFSPDGKSLTAVAQYGHMIDWDVADGKETRRIPDVGRLLAVSADGKRLAALDKTGGKIRVLDTTTAREVKMMPYLTGDERSRGQPVIRPEAVTFSPDCKELIGTTYEDQVLVYDLENGRRRVLVPANPLGGRIVQQSRAPVFSADGRLIALTDRNGRIRVIERLSGAERRLLDGRQLNVTGLAFSPDSRQLISAGSDGTALVWDLGLRPSAKAVETKLDEKQLEALWQKLGSDDAGKAEEALRALVASPSSAVGLLAKKVSPASAIDPEKIARWIADLESKQFATRKQAEDELAKIGQPAVSALEKALKEKPSLDLSQRIGGLLKKLESATLPTIQVHPLRAVEALEAIGTPEARKVLESLAKGAENALLTTQAWAALARMKSAP